MVVYLIISTSNHNYVDFIEEDSEVVYLIISTSNHNLASTFTKIHELYILSFLHQTTT